jgi:hypothetical protein
LKQGRQKADELKTVPNKLVADKYVVHYPTVEPKTERDKLYNSMTEAAAYLRWKNVVVQSSNLQL